MECINLVPTAGCTRLTYLCSMLSYWEQQSFLKYDHIVIGAGIVGLSTALELRDRFPSARILVLERGLLPTGASSRNAGFACMGSLTELLDDLRTTDEATVLNLFRRRKLGLERLRQRLGDHTIDYREEGSYELITEREYAFLDQLDDVNSLLMPVTGKPAFSLVPEKIRQFGFSGKVRQLVENTCEGSLHTGKMLRALTDLAIAQRIEIKTGAMVSHLEEQQDRVSVFVEDPMREELLALEASTVAVCTNAFTAKLIPGADVKPGRGQVLITQPIPGLKLKGIFHFDQGFYYFREIEGRVLIGGGRNLDIEGETTEAFTLSEKIQIALEQQLREVIIPGVNFHVAQRWSGIMAFGKTKAPIVQAFSPRLFGAFRMGGMGVALGSEVAMKLADLIAERPSS